MKTVLYSWLSRHAAIIPAFGAGAEVVSLLVRSRASDRVHGVLERANIQLAAVVEGWADPATMAALAKGRRRRKIPLLEQALTGLMRDHHRRVLVMQWAHLDFLDAQIETLNTEIAGGLRVLDPGEPPALPPAPAMTGEDTVKPASPLPPLTYERAIALWDTMPGVDRRGTEVWVAETGMEMAHFGTASRLAAWAGIAPGNDGSAGKLR